MPPASRIARKRKTAAVWHVYILTCGDGSLYTGIAIDVSARLQAHRAGKGAKYTRSRLPLHLAYRERAGTRSAALKREYAIKRLTRKKKMALAARPRARSKKGTR
ncbi:MAG: hypothetical protein RLZZ324_1033 [Candidatus Parcubacteria bacterium]|jgi:putative endonuclease